LFQIREADIVSQERNSNRPTPQLTKKHETPGGGTARGDRGSGGEEGGRRGGVFGGNIGGGNPVEVTPMKLARHLSSGKEDQRGAS